MELEPSQRGKTFPPHRPPQKEVKTRTRKKFLLAKATELNFSSCHWHTKTLSVGASLSFGMLTSRLRVRNWERHSQHFHQFVGRGRSCKEAETEKSEKICIKLSSSIHPACKRESRASSFKWQWRMPRDALGEELVGRLHVINEWSYRRMEGGRTLFH